MNREENRRRKGAEAEMFAASYLQGRGLVILEKNFRCRRGEIDIIAGEGEYLVFVEVKYRMSLCCGDPAESVTFSKQNTICRVSDYYRGIHGIPDDRPVRYDVIAVSEPASGDQKSIRWVRDAFSYISYY